MVHESTLASITAKLLATNALLGTHALAAMRLAEWNPSERTASFDVFHCESESLAFGRIIFRGVSYLQIPSRTQWGCQVRVATDAPLPSRGDVDAGEDVYEFFYPDATGPSAFVVAQKLDLRVGTDERAREV